MQPVNQWQLPMPILVSEYWCESRDADLAVFQLFQRHYTYKPDRKSHAFAGVGEKLVLVTPSCDAAFVWLKQMIRDDGQDGVCCTLFRNEGEILSSSLIQDACQLAYQRWGDVRLFTYVNPRKVKSSNPGYCFKMAGFQRCGETKWNKLLVLERPTASQRAAFSPAAERLFERGEDEKQASEDSGVPLDTL